MVLDAFELAVTSTLGRATHQIDVEDHDSVDSVPLMSCGNKRVSIGCDREPKKGELLTMRGCHSDVVDEAESHRLGLTAVLNEGRACQRGR